MKEKTHLPVLVDPSHSAGVKSVTKLLTARFLFTIKALFPVETPIQVLVQTPARLGNKSSTVKAHSNTKNSLANEHLALTSNIFAKFKADSQPYVQAAGKNLSAYDSNY